MSSDSKSSVVQGIRESKRADRKFNIIAGIVLILLAWGLWTMVTSFVGCVKRSWDDVEAQERADRYRHNNINVTLRVVE